MKMDIILFTLGEEKFALAIHQVERIMGYDLKKMNHEKSYVKGTIDAREGAFPVIDLKLFLMGEENNHENYIIVSNGNGETIGLIVDNVLGTEQIKDETIADIKVNGESINGLKAVKINEEHVRVIDMDYLLKEKIDVTSIFTN